MKDAWLTPQDFVDALLDAAAVRMVVSDGSNGLLDSLTTALPHAELQRCTVHKSAA